MKTWPVESSAKATSLIVEPATGVMVSVALNVDWLTAFDVRLPCTTKRAAAGADEDGDPVCPVGKVELDPVFPVVAVPRLRGSDAWAVADDWTRRSA